MNKNRIIILSSIICVLMSGCGKSEEVLYVEELISGIGKVTLNSKSNIERVERALEALDEKDFKKVKGIEDIENARFEYDGLIEDIEVSDVEDIINKIGSVTIDSEMSVVKARGNYNDISESAKLKVNNYNILEKAEQDILDLKVNIIVEAINGIGEVSVNSTENILNARSLYDDVKDDAKPKVSNYNILEKAEQDIFDLKVNIIVEAINEIGEVNAYSTESISNARSLYDDAEDDIKNAVHNYEVLEKAKTKFSEVIVNNIIDNINSIGTVSIDSEEFIESISKVYELLPNEDKEKVTNIDLLEQAKIRFTEVEEEYINTRKNALISKMKVEEDKISGNTWYQPKSQPQYINIRSYALPYTGIANNKVILRWIINYTGDDWIFFDNITIHIDGKNIEKSFNYFDIGRENGYGGVAERYDMLLSTDSDIQIIRDIVNSNEAIIRFNGKYSKRYDLTISASDKQATAEVLELYDLLKK